MNMTILTNYLPPGTSVAMSGDRRHIEVRTVDKTTYYSHSPLKEFRQIPKDTHFTPLFEIPRDVNEFFCLVKGETHFNDSFSRKSLNLIKKGATYSTIVDLGNSVEVQAAEFEMIYRFPVVLEESDNHCLLLGVLTRRRKYFKRDEGVCAILDLLGFSAIMESMSLDDLEQKYTHTLMSALAFMGIASVGAILIGDGSNLEVEENLQHISYGILSDTVVLYPKPWIDNPIRTLCEATALLLDISFEMDWAFRGAIDFGTFRAISEHNLFIGSAVINAHKAELSQNWSGCIVSPKLSDAFSTEIDQMLDDHLLVEYAVPIKKSEDGTIVSHEKRLAVNWTYFIMGQEDRRREKLGQLLAAAPEVGEHKLKETLMFHDEMKRLGYSSVGHPFREVYGDPTKTMNNKLKC